MKQPVQAARRAPRATLSWCAVALAALLGAQAAQAQPAAAKYPVTPQQQSTARQVAAKGVPLSALADNAPDVYTVKRGDTLWRISGLFLKTPWRWPELWGMNLRDIRNPHLIYPGQKLYLERINGRAYLRTSRSGEPDVVRVSPQTRAQMLGGGPLPTLEPHLIEPFLAEPLVFNADEFEKAPRIVAVAERDRVIVGKGDRIYVMGPSEAPLLIGPDLPTDFRVFRRATPLKDPVTGEVLGYEGVYTGQATLVRGEADAPPPPQDSQAASEAPVDWRPPQYGDQDVFPVDPNQPNGPLRVPATLDVTSSKSEMAVGDRLLPEPPAEYRNYVPHAPELPVDARVVSVYGGNAVRYAGQNQIVAINRGERHGLANGQVLNLMRGGQTITDKTTDARQQLQLPEEFNGQVMVFRVFDRVSYVLLINPTAPVQVGDRLLSPPLPAPEPQPAPPQAQPVQPAPQTQQVPQAQQVEPQVRATPQ